MTSLNRRLRRLEATTALGSLGRLQELDEFSRTAREYIRAVRQYLGEPPDDQIPIPCRNESEIGQLVNQAVAYRIRYLRHYRRQMNAEPSVSKLERSLFPNPRFQERVVR
jgi:hypothetical protein